MKIKGFVIHQALARKYQGIKSPEYPNAALFFTSKEDARRYLMPLIIERKRQAANGTRNADQLNPDTCLDFKIFEAEMEYDHEELLKIKNWHD